LFKKKVKYLDLFSGISAPTVAWAGLGWSAIAYAEIDNFASAVLSHHYPNVPNLGDVTSADWNPLKNKADILVAGSPCQSFSVSGNRESLLDERGNLALEFCRIANIVNPTFTVYENVPGILSAKLNPFGKLLSILVGGEIPLTPARGGSRWENSGFVVGPRRSVAWRVLCASNFGVPQRRRRVFLVAFDYRAGDRLFKAKSTGDITRLAGIPAAILLEPDGVSRDTSESAKCGENSTKSAGSRSKSGRGRLSKVTQQPDLWSVNPENPTFGRESDAENPTFGRDNSLENPTFGREKGNCVAFSFVDYAQDAGYISPTLRALSGKRLNGGAQVAIAYNITLCDANGTRKDRPQGGIYVTETETSSGLTCRGSESTTIAFRTDHTGANGIGVYSDGKTHTLSSSVGEGVVDNDLTPRRLTPIECLRLQGFPDNYLDILYKGKPAAKTQKYQVIGNSMAVPVVRWIGERIEKVVSLLKAF
jgi:DNA (cytosine-5)-methyltransferase 1